MLRDAHGEAIAASLGRIAVERTMSDWSNVAWDEGWADLTTAGIVEHLQRGLEDEGR